MHSMYLTYFYKANMFRLVSTTVYKWRVIHTAENSFLPFLYNDVPLWEYVVKYEVLLFENISSLLDIYFGFIYVQLSKQFIIGLVEIAQKRLITNTYH